MNTLTLVALTTEEAGTIDECIKAMRSGMATTGDARRLTQALMMGAARGINVQRRCDNDLRAAHTALDDANRERARLAAEVKECEELIESADEARELRQARALNETLRSDNAQMAENITAKNARIRDLEARLGERARCAGQAGDVERAWEIGDGVIYHRWRGKSGRVKAVYLGARGEKSAGIIALDPETGEPREMTVLAKKLSPRMLSGTIDKMPETADAVARRMAHINPAAEA